jgi:hypothetical protein
MAQLGSLGNPLPIEADKETASGDQDTENAGDGRSSTEVDSHITLLQDLQRGTQQQQSQSSHGYPHRAPLPLACTDRNSVEPQRHAATGSAGRFRGIQWLQ